MTNLTKKVVSGLTTGVLLLSLSSQLAFADTNLTITGNAEHSDNNVSVSNTSSTTVSQSNTANVNNNITSNTNTGGNHASDNIGQNGTGGVQINSGNTNSTTTVTNALNSNSADVANCGCQNATNVTVTGNGRGSDNTANLTQGQTTSASQSNTANVNNNVKSNSNTGGNSANDNLGGSVNVTSGNVSQQTSVSTQANANQLMIGSANNGAGTTGGTNLTIASNLEHSDNDINVTDTSLTTAAQVNAANVNNNVTNDANTGFNRADDNLGSVGITSGNVWMQKTSVDNAVNFNAADIEDCGCASSVNAKIGGNGKDSDNDLNGTIGNTSGVAQANAQTNLNNNVGGSRYNGGANTGFNSASDNGGTFVDPSITSGNTSSDTTVSNVGNVNTFGPATVNLPGNTQVNFTWGFLSAWMNGMFSMNG